MKKLLMLFVAGFALCSGIILGACGKEEPNPRWTILNTGTGVDLQAVHFVNERVGWIVGKKGTILYTKDGGKSFIKQNSGTGLSLLDVHFHDGSNGVAVGGGALDFFFSRNTGILLVTHDGGKNWRIQPEGGVKKLNAVRFLDANNVIAAGFHGAVHNSRDGGYTWRTQFLKEKIYIHSIAPINNSGLFLGGRMSQGEYFTPNYVILTLDNYISGTVESSISTYIGLGDKNNILDAFFFDNTRGWIVGENGINKLGMVKMTTDGGRTWNNPGKASSPISSIRAVTFVEGGQGWFAGGADSFFNPFDGGVLYAVTDGYGNNPKIKREHYNSKEVINDMVFINKNTGYMVGENGFAVKYESGVNEDPPLPSIDDEKTSEQPEGTHGEVKTVGGMEFVYIKGGEFWMGSNRSPEELARMYAKYGAKPSWFENEHPRHRVEVSGFWMGKYEVTQGQYKAVTGTNPSLFKGDSRRPVEQVSWHDVKSFCEKFGARHSVSARLPTEAEWEYAARAGTSTEFYWGDKIDGRYCWYYDNSNRTTHPVGKKLPNAWGLYDMAGNVWEWCEDWYDANYYAKSPVKDPKGPASGSYRVLRGCSWYSRGSMRSGLRYWTYPGYGGSSDGFRVVVVASR